MKKSLSLFVAVLLCVSFSTNASALEAANNYDIAVTLPAVPATSETISESNYNPIGDLAEDELKALQESLSYGCNSCITNRHFSLVPHAHEITSITSTYVGQRNRGVVAQSINRVPTTSQLIYERSRSVSNAWNATISFEKSAVTAELGYNCEYSTTATASYVLDIPPYKLGSITLYDMYDVTLFNCKTTWIYDTIPITYQYEFGTGWSEQWTHFGFGASIW